MQGLKTADNNKRCEKWRWRKCENCSMLILV